MTSPDMPLLLKEDSSKRTNPTEEPADDVVSMPLATSHRGQGGVGRSVITVKIVDYRVDCPEWWRSRHPKAAPSFPGEWTNECFLDDGRTFLMRFHSFGVTELFTEQLVVTVS